MSKQFEIKQGSEVHFDNTWWICRRVYKNRILLQCQDNPDHWITIDKKFIAYRPTIALNGTGAMVQVVKI